MYGMPNSIKAIGSWAKPAGKNATARALSSARQNNLSLRSATKDRSYVTVDDLGSNGLGNGLASDAQDKEPHTLYEISSRSETVAALSIRSPTNRPWLSLRLGCSGSSRRQSSGRSRSCHFWLLSHSDVCDPRSSLGDLSIVCWLQDNHGKTCMVGV